MQTINRSAPPHNHTALVPSQNMLFCVCTERKIYICKFVQLYLEPKKLQKNRQKNYKKGCFASAQILLKPILRRYFLKLPQRRVFVGREFKARNGPAFVKKPYMREEEERFERGFIHPTHPVAYFKKCHVLRVACWIQRV